MNHGGDVGALPPVVFVRPDDGLELPIGPVDVVLEHGEGEDVRQVGGDDDAAVAPLQVRHHEEVFARVAPKQMLGDVADGEGVGPTHVFRHDVGAIRSILPAGKGNGGNEMK